MLLDISKKDYDKEIIDLTLEKINQKFETLDVDKLIKDCDDDSKVKRMHAIDKIDDDEILFDIIMNAKYLDVREEALNKIGNDNDKVLFLKDILLKEKEYNESVNEYVMSKEDDEKTRQKLINQASNLGVEYKKVGNPKKEKFYSQQCKLFEK